MKTLGILGGMGPSASLELYRLLIEKSKSNGAGNNNAFPHILLSSLPVPDFIEDRSREEEAVHMVIRESKILEKAGADILVIACNTMHLHLSRFQEQVSIPFVSMIDAVVQKVVSDGASTVGLLGSPTTIETQLYQKPLSAHGIKVICPDAAGQKKITEVIFKIIAGNSKQSDVSELLRIAKKLQRQGASKIILGCTELPLVLNSSSGDDFISSLDILAQNTISYCYSKK